MSQSIVGVIISNPPQPIKAVFVPRLVQTAPNFALNGSTSSVSLVAGSNVTFQSNLSTITINAGGGVNSAVQALGTAGATSTGTIILAAGNNITLNTGASSITIVGAAAATSSVTASILGAALATNSITGTYSNSLVISVGGIITGAMSGNGNTLVLSATTLVQTSTVSLTAQGNTTSSISGSFSNLLNISGAGIVSVGVGNQSITISATTPSVTNYSTITGSMAGNTLGAASTTVTIGNNFSLSGAGIVSVGASGNTITISAPAIAAGGTQSFSGGGTSVTGSALSIALSGGNNISLASASGAGSLTLTFNASSNAISNVSLLNGSSGAMSVSAGAGIGIGQANSTITVSASVQTSSVTASVAGNTLSTASVTGAYSNSLVISAAGIISGAMSTSGNTLILSATTPSVTNFSTISLSASGNTTGASSGTMNNVLAISGAGIVSVGAGAGGSFTISASTPSVTNFSTISGSITGNTAGTGTFTIGTGLNISLTGGLSGTASGSSITLSGATGGGAGGVQTISASTTAVTGSAISLALFGGTNVTLSTATGAGSMSVSFNANPVTTLVAGSGISLTSGGSSITIIASGAPISLVQNFDLHNAAGTVVTKAGTVTGTAGVGSSLFLSRITIPSVMNLTEIDVAMSIGFNATNGGAGTMSRSFALYSFQNSTAVSTLVSASGTSAWSSGTSTTAGAVSLTQFQGGWSTPLIQPFTFASSSVPPGEYVVGQLFNFAQATSTWTIAFYGDQDAVTATVSTFATAAGSGVTGTVAGSVITAITQNATNNVSWFVSRATSGTTSVASATSSFTFVEAPFVGSIGTAAGSAITGVTAGSIITATGSATVAQLSLPNFGYIGTGSTTSGFPTAFMAGIMSTGAVPAAITITSNAVTFSGSAAFLQPWFALVGT